MDEVIFELAPGGTYGRATEGIMAGIDLWCAGSNDILVVRGEDKDAVPERLREATSIRTSLDVGGRNIVLTDECLRDETQTVEPFVERRGCVLVPPLHYGAGRKRCRVWATEPAQLTALFRDLSAEWEVTVDAKRTVDDAASPQAPNDAVHPSLSDRQAEALARAIDAGYYAIPRETTTADIAAAMGVERRTAETHLRLAEQKVMEAFASGR